MNFVKFLRTPFLQNKSGRLLLNSKNKYFMFYVMWKVTRTRHLVSTLVYLFASSREMLLKIASLASKYILCFFLVAGISLIVTGSSVGLSWYDCVNLINVSLILDNGNFWKLTLRPQKINRLALIQGMIISTTEAVARMCSVKNLFLKILQNSWENTFARISFIITLQASPCNFI